MIAALVAVWALAFAGTVAVGVGRGMRLRRCGTAPGGCRPFHVVLIRPCRDRPAYLLDTLTSILDARYGFRLSVRITVAETTDPATEVALEAASRLRRRGVDAALVVTGVTGPNRKAEQIAHVVSTEPGAAVVVAADADVDLTDADLDALVGPLHHPGVGATWTPIAEAGPPTHAGDHLSAAILGGSLHAFPFLCGLDPEGLVGKLFAFRRSAVRAAGGFAAVTGYLGEDFALARRLRSAGLRVLPVCLPIRSVATGRRISDVLARHRRWMTVVRSQRPALLPTYPLLLCAAPSIVALGLLVAAQPLGAFAAGIVVAARLVAGAAARRWSGRRFSLPATTTEAVAADLALLTAFVGACSGRTVTWGGRRLVVGPAGLLHER